MVNFNVTIINHFDESTPFLVEELNFPVPKMLMRCLEIPFTRWTEIRVYELQDKKMMDPHCFVLAFDVMTIPR